MYRRLSLSALPFLALPLLVASVLVALTGSALAADPDGEVKLSLARFEQMMAAARGGDGPTVTWSRGDIEVTLPTDGGHVVTVRLVTSVRVAGESAGPVPLLPADVVLNEATIHGSPASFSTRGGVLMADMSPDWGDTSVVLVYQVAASDSGVVIPLPPLPGAALRASGARGIEVWPALDASSGSGTSIATAIPSTHGVFLRWEGTDSGHVVRSAEFDVQTDRGGDGVEVTATYDVRLSGPSASVRIAPEGAALVDVREGREAVEATVGEDGHLHCAINGAGRHVIVARFRLPIDRSQGQPQVTIGVAEVPITRALVTVPGQRDVIFQPEVPLETTVSGSGDASKTTALAHLPPTEEITFRWTETRAAPEELTRVNTETYQLVTLDEAVMRSRIVIRYSVIRGKTKELSVVIPDDAVLFKVSGDGVDDWTTFAAADGSPRLAKIYLADELDGDYTLELGLESVVPTAEGAALALPVVRPLNAHREMSVVALFDGAKVGFAPADATGYTKVGEDALPTEIRRTLTDKVTQAFKHVGDAPGPIASKVASAKVREVRFDARVHSLYLVKEGALIGNASVMVEIKSGRRNELILDLPEHVTVLDVTAPSMNKAEPARDGYAAAEGRKGHRVSFTRALEGAVQIDLEFEMLLPKDLGKIALPDVVVVGAEVQEGALGITAETGIEVQPAGETELRRVDVGELPRAVRLRSERELLVGYTWARAPWTLDVDVRRHKTVETLQTVVSHLWLLTTLLEDGHIVTHATFDVANGDQQFLRLSLPEGHKVWIVAADGKEVKAVADDAGALAIPLPKHTNTVIDVVYDVPRAKLGSVGSVEMSAPKADLVVTDVKWLVRRPVRYQLFNIDTELRDREAHQFYSGYQQTPGLRIPFTIPADESYSENLFTHSVHDPSDESLTIGFGYFGGPGEELGWLLTLLGVLLLVPAIRARFGTGTLAGRQRILALAGIVLVAAKALSFGFDGVEATLLVVVVVGAAVTAWWQRRTEQEDVA